MHECMLWVCRTKLGYAGLRLTRSTRNPKTKRRRPNADDLCLTCSGGSLFLFFAAAVRRKTRTKRGRCWCGQRLLAAAVNKEDDIVALGPGGGDERLRAAEINDETTVRTINPHTSRHVQHFCAH